MRAGQFSHRPAHSTQNSEEPTARLVHGGRQPRLAGFTLFRSCNAPALREHGHDGPKREVFVDERRVCVGERGVFDVERGVVDAELEVFVGERGYLSTSARCEIQLKSRAEMPLCFQARAARGVSQCALSVNQAGCSSIRSAVKVTV